MEGGRAEDILARTTAAALAVSSADGATLFHDLVRRLAEILDVDADADLPSSRRAIRRA